MPKNMLDEKAVMITWLRCDCGKLHAAAGMSTISRCTCGVKVQDLFFRS